MAKKLKTTPRSRVRAALRQVWLRSRERAAALKRAGNCCERCGRKHSKAKGKECVVEVHHVDGVQWQELLEIVYEQLLCDPARLEALCVDCHDKDHEEDWLR